MSSALAPGEILMVESSELSTQGQSEGFAIVVSAQLYNQNSAVVWTCPIISLEDGIPKNKGFTVYQDGSQNQTKGHILCDQIRAIRAEAGKAKKLGKASDEVLGAVLGKMSAILQL